MDQSVTIQGELRVPHAFVQGRLMEVIEQQLYDYGLLPPQARERRWRMDTDHPGGYILLFTVALEALPAEEPPWAQ